jgi:hypothetical protein
MCNINPEFLPNVRYENGKKVLYMQILKALYGMEYAHCGTSYTRIITKGRFRLNEYMCCKQNYQWKAVHIGFSR